MQVTTDSGYVYSYIRKSNLICDGVVEGKDDILHFVPYKPITELADIDTFTICVTNRCNLRCSYCCYSGQYPEHRKHGNVKFDKSQIPDIWSFVCKTARKDQIIISFYGGECVLAIDFIKEFISYASSQNNLKVKYDLSTNGTLLNPSLIDWLVDNDITLFVSIDGAKTSHDKSRVFPNGDGSFDKMISAISYIKSKYSAYLQEKVCIMMTVSAIDDIKLIAKEWNEDEILHDIPPTRIAFVATNYHSTDYHPIDYHREKEIIRDLIETYDKNRDWVVLDRFFKLWLAEWISRPQFDIDEAVEYPTCVPYNRKLYIDITGEIGICEKISDDIRFGDIKHGIDWAQLNTYVEGLARRIHHRCPKCEIARVCDICPDVLSLDDEQMDLYCSDQKTTQLLKFYAFCELAERELI